MTPPDDDQGEKPDEVPPPKIIKVEDYSGMQLAELDAVSPYPSLDGDYLERDDAVALVRLDSEDITRTDGEGVLVGESITDLTYLMGELGGRQGAVRVREMAFRNSLDIAFSSDAVEDTVLGAASKERNGADRLRRALASPDYDSFLKALGVENDALAKRIEPFLLRLFERQVTLDIQTPDNPPVRVGPERAAVLYNALRLPQSVPPSSPPLIGKLVGATLDTRDFKLRLTDAWNGREVVEGKFPESLDAVVEANFNHQVMATVRVTGERRGIRPAKLKFTLTELQPAATLPGMPETEQ